MERIFAEQWSLGEKVGPSTTYQHSSSRLWLKGWGIDKVTPIPLPCLEGEELLKKAHTFGKQPCARGNKLRPDASCGVGENLNH
jgi:hypothetical protein